MTIRSVLGGCAFEKAMRMRNVGPADVAAVVPRVLRREVSLSTSPPVT